MSTLAAPLAAALATGPVVLDGGLSTELERRGHDVSGALWSAALLTQSPAAVRDAHVAFAEAGAQVLTTASYQATFEGFARAGLDHAEAERLMRLSVTLAREALETMPGRSGWVAASVGPYGALLADGSEYTGAYVEHLDVAALRRFHRPRLEVLAGAGADVLACETVPAAAEAEALLAEIDALGVPAWLSLTTVLDADGTVRTRRGEEAAAVFALAAQVDAVIAVGVNCLDPDGALPAVHVAAEASGKPVVVYPNSGERWDAAARTWRDTPVGGSLADAVPGWSAAGARLIGGCCRVGPDQVAAIATAAGSTAGSLPSASPVGD